MQADRTRPHRWGIRAGARGRMLAAASLLIAAALAAGCTSPRPGEAENDSAAVTGPSQGAATQASSLTGDRQPTEPAPSVTVPPLTSPDSSDPTGTETTRGPATSTSSMTTSPVQTGTESSTPAPPEDPETDTDARGNAVVWGGTPVAAVTALRIAIDQGGPADVGQPGLTILVPAAAPSRFGPALDAARSLAADVGAQVQALADSDPRNDPAAIKALAASPPQRVIGFGPDFGPVDRFVTRVATAATGVELPGGGQVMFPNRTLVALYGYPGSTALGALGQQDLDAAIARAQRVASGYKKWVTGPIVPTFEIIATVATAGAGADGDYSAASTVARLRPWVEAASDAGMYVVLDLQPGRANLLQQANLYVDLLRLPNVGLALDPEWKLAPGQKPLQQIGGVDAAEVNSVIDWLGRLTAANHLPQKVLVLHQFQLSMLRDSQQIRTDDDDVAVLIHMDGQGSPGGKESTWKSVVGAAPPGVVFGWKNFFVKDKPMLTPEQTMDRTPAPVMISYQ